MGWGFLNFTYLDGFFNPPKVDRLCLDNMDMLMQAAGHGLCNDHSLFQVVFGPVAEEKSDINHFACYIGVCIVWMSHRTQVNFATAEADDQIFVDDPTGQCGCLDGSLLMVDAGEEAKKGVGHIFDGHPIVA